MKKYLLLYSTLLMATNAFASDLFELGKSQLDLNKQPRIQASLSSTMLSFRVPGQGNGGSVSIVGPDGYSSTQIFTGSSDTLNLLESESLAAKNSSTLPPGRYNYRIATHIGPLKLVQDTMDNGRGEDNFTYAGEPLIQYGSFVVQGGSVKNFQQIREPEAIEW